MLLASLNLTAPSVSCATVGPCEMSVRLTTTVFVDRLDHGLHSHQRNTVRGMHLRCLQAVEPLPLLDLPAPAHLLSRSTASFLFVFRTSPLTPFVRAVHHCLEQRRRQTLPFLPFSFLTTPQPNCGPTPLALAVSRLTSRSPSRGDRLMSI